MTRFGLALSDLTQKYTNQVLVAARTGVIGTDNAVRFNDANSGLTGNLENNVGTSNTIGSLYIQFDLLNNAPNASATDANPVIF